MLSAFDNVYGTAADYCIVDVANVRPLPENADLELGRLTDADGSPSGGNAVLQIAAVAEGGVLEARAR